MVDLSKVRTINLPLHVVQNWLDARKEAEESDEGYTSKYIEYEAEVLEDAMRAAIMRAGVCPYDTDGDGDCGRVMCPHCSGK